jgi:hypothetical protein
MKRRMLRKASKKRRANPSKKRPSVRKRRRRNEDAPKKARKPAVKRSAAELAAFYRAKAEAAESRAAKPKKVKKGRPEGYGAKTRAARLRKLARIAEADPSLLRVGLFGRGIDDDLRRAVAQTMVERKKAQAARAEARAAKKMAKKQASRKKVTKRARFARLTLRKGSKSSAPSKAIAKAWRAAMNAQKKAKSPAEQKLLRSMGLAGVPNPGVGGMFKDIGTLMPQIGASAAALAGVAFAGQKIGAMIEARVSNETAKRVVVPAVSVGLALGGYMLARRVKPLAKFSMPILLGGMAAAVVHSIVRVKIGDKTIAQQLGLPLGEYAAMAGYGEYAAMAGMGEYAAMAGGTAYSGEQGIFAGLDDVDPVLSGTDDEDEISFTETLADEGVNADEGSLNGSIFD